MCGTAVFDFDGEQIGHENNLTTKANDNATEDYGQRTTLVQAPESNLAKIKCTERTNLNFSVLSVTILNYSIFTNGNFVVGV